MKGRVCEGCRLSFGKIRHCFVGTTSSYLHHKVDDASTLTCAVVVPQILPKVYFHASIGAFSVGCVIKGIAVVTLGRLDTAGVQIVRYRHLLDILQVVIFVVHCCYHWIWIIHLFDISLFALFSLFGIFPFLSCYPSTLG